MFKRFKKETHSAPLIVSDLDSILSETIAFKLHGKVFEIKPITAVQFFKYTEAMTKLFELKDRVEIAPADLVMRYHDIFSQICPSLTVEDVEKCTQQQIAGLFTLIVETVSGKKESSLKKN